MSGIPYNKLMTVSTPICDTDGNQVAEVSTDFAFVIPCKDCRMSAKGGTLCGFFAGYEPVLGGDEYAEFPAIVEPDGFCAWGERAGDA